MGQTAKIRHRRKRRRSAAEYTAAEIARINRELDAGILKRLGA